MHKLSRKVFLEEYSNKDTGNKIGHTLLTAEPLVKIFVRRYCSTFALNIDGDLMMTVEFQFIFAHSKMYLGKYIKNIAIAILILL